LSYRVIQISGDSAFDHHALTSYAKDDEERPVAPRLVAARRLSCG